MIAKLTLTCVLLLCACAICFALSRRETDELLAKRARGDELPQQQYEQLVEAASGFTDAQLVSVLHSGKADYLRDECRREITTRAALRPHWTVIPAFWLIVASVATSIAALVLAWRAEVRGRSNAK